MASYSPSINDIQELEPAQSGYQPTLSDIPSDIQDQQLSPIPFNPGFVEKLAPNILAGMAELGHSILNAPSNVAQFAASKGWLNPQTAQAIPRQADYNYSQMLGLPGTTGDVLTQSLIKNIPSFALPEAKGLGFIPEALSRVVGQGVYGGLTNENVGKGAEEYGLTQAAMEGLRTPFKVVSQVAEWMNPLKYTENTMSDIKTGYQNAVDAQKAAYKPVTDKYGDVPVTDDPKNYLGFTPLQRKRFTPEVKLSYDEFVDNPNFQNLHDLQSQMGRDWSRISTNPGKINTAQNLDLARKFIQDKISDFLSPDQEAFSQYQKGREITRDLVSPYTSNPDLNKIANGTMTSASPQKLANIIAKGTQKIVGRDSEGNIRTAIPPNHPLVSQLVSVQNRINRGNALENTLAAVAGAGGGYLGGISGSFLHPEAAPLAALAGGIGTGLLTGAKILPGMTSFAQNPSLVDVLSKAMSGIQGAGRLGVGYNMYNS